MSAACTLIWFASGVVMLFVTYPVVDDAQRLAWRAPLSALPTTVPALPGAAPTRLRWRQLVDRVVVDVEVGGARRTVELDGRPLAPLTPAQAIAAVPAGLGGRFRHDATLARPDQWTLFGSQRAQLPAHRLRDPGGVEVHVAVGSGEIVQRTTPRQRLLCWLGPIAHWLYPAVLVQHRPIWRQLVIALATVGMISTASGLALGLWSLRRRRSPFARPWLRAHHYLGLGFGLVTFTWLLSGALSLGPFRWSPGSAPGPVEQDALGGPLALAPERLDPGAALAACAPALEVRELELRAVLGRPTWICRATTGTRLVDAGSGEVSRALDRGRVIAALGRAGLVVAAATTVDEDAYLHPSLHGGRPPAPVYRLELADHDRTRLYVDPGDGRVLARYGARARLERWLYRGLHSLDPPGLRERPWLRRGLALLLLAGGLALAVTSVVGVRRRRRAAAAHSAAS